MRQYKMPSSETSLALLAHALQHAGVSGWAMGPGQRCPFLSIEAADFVLLAVLPQVRLHVNVTTMMGVDAVVDRRGLGRGGVMPLLARCREDGSGKQLVACRLYDAASRR
jgi:hypothetical protein